MTSAAELTLAFIRRRPDAAAQVLASLTVKDAAAFIDSIPTRYAVTVFQTLNASAAASIMKHMDPTSVTAAIREMEFAAASAILRQQSQSDRQTCMADLPRDKRRELDRALSFASDSVGSRMTTDIPSLAAGRTVAEALGQIRENKDGNIDSVFVVDDQRRYLGAVHVLALLRRPATTRLKDLIDTSCPHVSPNASLEQVGELPSWQMHRQLPVVSRRGDLVGTIDRKSLGQFESADASMANSEPQPAVALLMGAMLDCSGSLIALLAPPISKRNVVGDSNGR